MTQPATISYFMPGQVGLVFTHAPGLTLQQRAASAPQHPALSGEALLVNASALVDRVITFNQSAEQAVSLVFLDLTSQPQPDAFIPLIDRLNGRKGTVGNGLTLSSATPNWLTPATQPHNKGIGGPGTRPQPYQPSGSSFWHMQLPASLNLPSDGSAGQGVDVAILDSVPSAAQLASAYRNWQASNPLIARLLLPNGPLTIRPAWPNDLAELANSTLEDHNYDMSDHGLFIAGLVNSIVPAAQLELIQVLNAYGVGSAETIARGFQRLINTPRTRPLIVNCSFMLSVAPADDTIIQQMAAHDPIWNLFTAATVLQMSDVFKLVCETLEREQVIVVGSAGNDREPGTPPPPARFPAAYNTVFGVSALDPAGAAAGYSNICDSPVGVGIATLGGAAEGPDAGVIGIYTGAFPDGGANNHGWARWSGTSFAAPIVSAALAGLKAQGKTDQQAIDTLRAALTSMTDVGQQLPVQQG